MRKRFAAVSLVIMIIRDEPDERRMAFEGERAPAPLGAVSFDMRPHLRRKHP